MISKVFQKLIKLCSRIVDKSIENKIRFTNLQNVLPEFQANFMIYKIHTKKIIKPYNLAHNNFYRRKTQMGHLHNSFQLE